jgi:hypothetical protein
LILASVRRRHSLTEPDAPNPRRPWAGSNALGLVVLGSALLIVALVIALVALGSGSCDPERQDSVFDCLIPMFWAVVVGLPGLIVLLVGLALRFR